MNCIHASDAQPLPKTPYRVILCASPHWNGCQGFPDWYVLDEVGGKPVTKTQQIHKIGNSVCHHVAKALAGANYVPGVRERKQLYAPLLAV